MYVRPWDVILIRCIARNYFGYKSDESATQSCSKNEKSATKIAQLEKNLISIVFVLCVDGTAILGWFGLLKSVIEQSRLMHEQKSETVTQIICCLLKMFPLAKNYEVDLDLYTVHRWA